MTYWLREVASNPAIALPCLIVLGSVVLRVVLIMPGWFKRHFEQAAFMIPHYAGAFYASRTISPRLFVIELRRTLVVVYATDKKEADQISKMRWLRKALNDLKIDDARVWNGRTEITLREADPIERIRFMSTMQGGDEILLDCIKAGDPLSIVLVDRDRRFLVKIGCT